MLHRELEILFLACRNYFSSIGLDRRHEQQNKDVKVDEGFLGLIENEEKLRRWIVCGPEVEHAVSEFKTACVFKKKDKMETPSFQK